MEIEIKAVVVDERKLLEELAHKNTTQKKESHQIDVYYNHPSRDTRKTNEYIRLRYKYGHNIGIFALHINIADGVNKEYEVQVEDIETFKAILDKMGFPLLGVIDKQRATYTLEQFTITIDKVKDVDTFVEVEVDGKESEIIEKKQLCLNLMASLGISKENICKNVWLCDIATGRIDYKK